MRADFKRQRSVLTDRRPANKTPKPGSLLIVTEGEKTEPLYLRGLTDYIKAHCGGGQLNVCVTGVGLGTINLVNEAVRIANRAPYMYESKWVCFDKDNFDDFDQAIAIAKENGFRAAWSNQSFEYWLYLHFHYSDSALHRDVWLSKVDGLLQTLQLGEKGYSKNMTGMFAAFANGGRLKTAVTNATRRERQYESSVKPSLRDPCTTVHHLVCSLEQYLDEFLKD